LVGWLVGWLLFFASGVLPCGWHRMFLLKSSNPPKFCASQVCVAREVIADASFNVDADRVGVYGWSYGGYGVGCGVEM